MSSPSDSAEPFIDQLPPELLREIGDQIVNRQQLYNLCLVNRKFHKYFTPALYADFEIILDRYRHIDNKGRPVKDEEWQRYRAMANAVEQSVHLRWVRRFRYEGGFRQRLLSFLAHMPQLRELYVCQPEELTKEMAESVVKLCPKLASLFVGPISRTYLAKPESINEALTTFRGLHSLMLAGLSLQLEPYQSGIISALLACPALQEFGISTRYNEQGSPLARLSSTWRDQYRGAFGNICRGYAQRGGLPLRLKRLSLGRGVGFRRENIDRGVRAEEAGLTPSRESYLSLLLDPSVLEEVYVGNTGEFEFEQAWWSFGQDKTPNLRRLAADTYTRELGAFLADCDAEYIQGLALFFSTPTNCRSIGSFFSKCMVCRSQSSDRAWVVNQPHRLRMSEEVLAFTYCEVNWQGCRWFAEDMMAGKSWIKERDRKYTEWSSLTGLSIRMAESDEKDGNSLLYFLFDVIRLLSRLRQFQLTSKTMPLKSLAANIAVMPRALRYLRINGDAWSVEHDRFGTVRGLQPLDEREQQEIELFRPACPLDRF